MKKSKVHSKYCNSVYFNRMNCDCLASHGEQHDNTCAVYKCTCVKVKNDD